MEQHLAATGADMYGLEQGDSRYFVWRCNWCALGGMDRFVRDHKTKSLIDYAQNKAPGEMLSLWHWRLKCLLGVSQLALHS